jgi:hypothetical protein
MALKLLVTFAWQKGIRSLHIFGDSMIAINWVNKSQCCHNIRLLPILEEIFITMGSFDGYSVRHVFRERNMVVDLLSKAYAQLVFG